MCASINQSIINDFCMFSAYVVSGYTAGAPGTGLGPQGGQLPIRIYPEGRSRLGFGGLRYPIPIAVEGWELEPEGPLGAWQACGNL
jgi:hypothetical protein